MSKRVFFFFFTYPLGHKMQHITFKSFSNIKQGKMGTAAWVTNLMRTYMWDCQPLWWNNLVNQCEAISKWHNDEDTGGTQGTPSHLGKANNPDRSFPWLLQWALKDICPGKEGHLRAIKEPDIQRLHLRLKKAWLIESCLRQPKPLKFSTAL